MTRAAMRALAVALSVAACGGQGGGGDDDAAVVSQVRVAELDGEAVVALDSAIVAEMGLVTAELRPATGAVEVRLPAELVADTGRIGTLRAAIAGRLALAPGATWPEVGQRVEAGAPLAVVSDAAPLAPSLSGTVTSVGARPGEMVAAGQVLLQVADLTRPLVRVPWPSDAPASPPQRIGVTRLDGAGRPVAATLVGPSLGADAATRQPAFLYRAEGSWPGAAPGVPVWALLPGEPAPAGAALVPDAAVLQWEGLAWVFVERAPGRYARVRIPTDRPARDGWIAVGGVKPGDRVVVRGGQQLLSEEFRSRVKVGDEAGE